MKLRRVQFWASWALLAFLSLIVVSAVYAQQTDFDRRMAEQEAVHAEQRLTRLETRLDGLMNVGTGILIIVGAQLVMSGLNLRARKGER